MAHPLSTIADVSKNAKQPPVSNLLTQLLTSAGICILLLVFATAGLAKLAAMDQLVATMDASQLLPVQLSPYLAVLVVVWELLLAFGLLWARVREIALWGCTFTLLAFAGYGIWRAVKHINVPCNCFGVLFKMSPTVSITLCFALLVVTILLLKKQSKGYQISWTNA